MNFREQQRSPALVSLPDPPTSVCASAGDAIHPALEMGGSGNKSTPAPPQEGMNVVV